MSFKGFFKGFVAAFLGPFNGLFCQILGHLNPFPSYNLYLEMGKIALMWSLIAQ